MENMFTSSGHSWEKWETKLVVYSILAGIAGLLVLGWFLNVWG